MNQSEERAVNTLCDAITRHIEATSRLQRPGNENNAYSIWKLRESSLLALSISKESIIKNHLAGLLRFDLIRFFDTIVLAILNDPGIIFHYIYITLMNKII